jgi:hypothetical protein
VVSSVGVAMALASACTGSGSGSRAGVTKATATTEAPTTVAEAPTTTIAPSPRTIDTLPTALGPGPAHVGGSVVGPDGPVPGAVVRVERLVDDAAVAATTVQAGADGRWAVDSVNGGRYRLRAWRPPDLAQLTPVVVFVAVDDVKPVDLAVLRYPGDGNAVARIVPEPPKVGQQAVLAVGVSNGGVDADGVLHAQARPGLSVTLTLSANVAITTPTAVVTDASGNAGFGIVCNQAGPITAVVTVATAQQTVAVPPCVP